MLGVIVAGDTATDLIAYCPFHSNKDSPAFNISLAPPHLWKCHNGKCDKAGNIISLLTLKGYTRNEAEKIVTKGSYDVSDLLALVEQMMADPKSDAREDWKNIDAGTFQEADRASGFPVREYMLGRDISEEACAFFGIGYSASKHMAVIPVFDERARLSGVIGRELETKRYQYSTGLGRGELIWNLHNAKQCESVILTEGALDAVYVWQAGFHNVGAVLGSSISPRQWGQLRKHFTEIICFFDNDEAGVSLTDTIIGSIHDLSVSYVTYPDRMVTFMDRDGESRERPIKDPGELHIPEIADMVENRKSSLDVLFNGA